MKCCEVGHTTHMSITFSIIALAPFVLPPNVLLAQSLFSRTAKVATPQPGSLHVGAH